MLIRNSFWNLTLSNLVEYSYIFQSNLQNTSEMIFNNKRNLNFKTSDDSTFNLPETNFQFILSSDSKNVNSNSKINLSLVSLSEFESSCKSNDPLKN